MNLWQAILYGLVQGITEFLPVSSSGHLTLLGQIFKSDESAMLSFTTLLHVGTLIAVFVVMRKEILAILKDLLGLSMRLIVLATVPAVLAAVLLGGLIERLFGGGFLGYAFLLTGIVLAATWLSKRARSGQDKPVGYREALVAGVAQAVAIAPGVSRSGMTLAALLFSGVDREKAIRFSFLMSIPAILGGFLFDVIDMLQGEGAALAAFGAGNILAGVLAAALAGYLAMEFMLRRLTRRGFLVCAVYVAVLGILVPIDQNLIHLVFA
ncbi:MAG: undecaprenyl-diphosphate phosphatase [Clostridiaceae bacterium]|nr:undecaprenyl-diphosphate phosphatase [Clostridiaceae bacterium]